ncbi:MAG TPA: hypothetical protein VGN63_00455 [Flavisolibacter sp.]|jgi:hypothetical protein|nr:hypothetical protein [Flavisolibacter sp.]
MDSDQFILLLKKEILRESTLAEQMQLKKSLEQNEDYKNIYHTIFNGTSEQSDDAEDAYNRHIHRMKKLKLL